LRAAPFIDADEVGLVPHSVTLPIIGRNPDASWLYVNYIGYIGWISGSQVRPFGDVMSAPVAYQPEELASLVYIGEVIPPEVQLAHVYQMRDHVAPLAQMSDDLARYWDILLLGEIFPCEPPPFAIEFPRSERDVMELPELGFLLPQLDRGTDLLNESVAALQECGAFEEDVIIDARNAAINANILLRSVNTNLNNVEAIIR
ncbi:MAG: SH3 domain-containing protein, partial [Burkholderiales bacterium]|nr:SH3 domain-containing protein [Anaerolineae bacterium]